MIKGRKTKSKEKKYADIPQIHFEICKNYAEASKTERRMKHKKGIVVNGDNTRIFTMD